MDRSREAQNGGSSDSHEVSMKEWKRSRPIARARFSAVCCDTSVVVNDRNRCLKRGGRCVRALRSRPVMDELRTAVVGRESHQAGRISNPLVI